MEEFGRIIRAEGWDYYPDGPNATNRIIAQQYRDKSERLSATALNDPNLAKAAEYCRLAADYILLAERVESDIIAE